MITQQLSSVKLTINPDGSMMVIFNRLTEIGPAQTWSTGRWYVLTPKQYAALVKRLSKYNSIVNFSITDLGYISILFISRNIV